MLNKELLMIGNTTAAGLVEIQYLTETNSPLTISASSYIGEELGVILPDESGKIIELPLHTTLYFRAPLADEIIYTGCSSGVEISVPIQNSLPNRVKFSITKIIASRAPRLDFDAY